MKFCVINNLPYFFKWSSWIKVVNNCFFEEEIIIVFSKFFSSLDI